MHVSNRKGRITSALLEKLVTAAMITSDLLEIFLSSHATSYKVVRRILYGKPRHEYNEQRSHRDEELQRFYSLLNKLKRDGLVEKKTTKGHSSLWSITHYGQKKLKLLRSKKSVVYHTTSDNKLKIITFDIPEKERRKRSWLREVLRRLGFSILQKSVWIGKNHIPKEFLLDARKMNIIKYIHILEVGAAGTIKRIS